MNLVNYYMSELYIICNKNCILIQYHYRYVHSSIDLNYTCDNNSDWSVYSVLTVVLPPTK